VIEKVDNLPTGVIGFRASGKISRDEYHQMMQPIYALLEEGDPVNLLFVIDADFRGLDVAALWEDMKAAGSVGLKHRKAWERMALVTDKDWIRHGAAGFAWLAPGELRVFDPEQMSDATDWLAKPAS
jgi:hypothetical protein